MNRISKRLFSITGLALLGLSALVLLMPAPAGADDFNNQGLKPPAYKYYSQYARKNGMYLNLGNIAYVRVPTIRLRVGAVKFREVQFINGHVGHFVTGAGRYRPGGSSYGRQQRIVLPIKTPYYYKPYGSGGPFYGQPSGYVANYYGQPGYGMPNGRYQGGQLGYGEYGFNTSQALQGLPNGQQQQQKAYRGTFNEPKQVIGYNAQPPRPKPRLINVADALAKNAPKPAAAGHLPVVHKPAGQNLIRVQ